MLIRILRNNRSHQEARILSDTCVKLFLKKKKKLFPLVDRRLMYLDVSKKMPYHGVALKGKEVWLDINPLMFQLVLRYQKGWGWLGLYSE